MKRVLALALGVMGAATATALEFEAADGVVRAREGEAVVWENVHDRGGHFRGAERPGRLVGPVVSGDAVYYAVGISLYEVDPASGVVRRRLRLPEGSHALGPTDDGVLVEVAYEGTSGPGTRSYRVDPHGALPFFLSGNLLAARMTRDDAERVLHDRLPPERRKSGPEPEWRTTPEARPHLDAATAELTRLAERDPTNPWYRYWLGVYLRDLGRAEEARAAFESVLAASPENDGELLALALPLDAAAPELGPLAFERGLRFLRAQGVEPELISSLITVLIYYGSPVSEGPLDGTRDLERLDLLGERLWDLAPHSEYVSAAFQGLADANRAAGRLPGAELWEARARESLPFRAFGFGQSVERAGPAFNATLAALLAVVLGFVVKGLGTVSAQRGASGMPRWNTFCWWTRGEIVGFLLVQAVALASAWSLARSLTVISNTAAAPIGAVAGSLGHPAAVDYLATYRGTPAGEFVNALALQQAGELDAAAAIYATLDAAQARNNLGVIQQLRGDAAGARRLFEEALALEPGLAEAAFNLGQPARSSRVERAVKYGRSAPIVALPTPAMWDEALAGPIRPGVLFDFVTFQSVFASSAAPPVARAAVVEPQLVVAALFALAGLMAIAGLFARARLESAPPSYATRAARLLGLLVPGTSRRLGGVGIPLLFVALFSAVVQITLVTSGGVATNLFDAIATPSVARAYGFSGRIDPPLDAYVRRTAPLWWMIAVANLLVVGFLERRARRVAPPAA